MLLIRNDYFFQLSMTSTVPNLGPADPAVQAPWKIKDSEARANLIPHCGNAQIQLVCSCTMTKVIWDKLKST